MKDIAERLEKLRSDAADCALISDLAPDRAKRELFSRLAEHLSVLAADLERELNAGTAKAER